MHDYFICILPSISHVSVVIVYECDDIMISQSVEGFSLKETRLSRRFKHFMGCFVPTELHEGRGYYKEW